MEDEQFDLKIKAILEEGREEVPDRIWGMLDSRLDDISVKKAGKTEKLPAWWLRSAGIGLAVAASLTVAVIFSGIGERGQNTALPSGEELLAVAEKPDTEEEPADTDLLAARDDGADVSYSRTPEEKTTVPDAIVSPDAVPVQDNAVSDGEQTCSHPLRTFDGGDETKKDDSVAENHRQKEAAEKDNTAGQWEDPFSGLGETVMPGRKIRTSLILSGNAVSNTNAERNNSRMLMSPGVLSKSTVSETGESRYGIPVSFGAGVRIGFTEKWSVGIGLNYSLLSRTFDGVFYDVAENGGVTQTAYTDIRNTQHYIGIPVNVYYNILEGGFIDFYTYAGGSAEYCLADKYSMGSGDNLRIHKGSAGAFQFSVDFGIGVEFRLAKNVGLYIDPSLRYYFRSSNIPKSIRTAQPLMLGFEAGIKFSL